MNKQDRELTRMVNRNAECAEFGRRLNAIAAKRHRVHPGDGCDVVTAAAICGMAMVSAVSLMILVWL